MCHVKSLQKQNLYTYKWQARILKPFLQFTRIAKSLIADQENGGGSREEILYTFRSNDLDNISLELVYFKREQRGCPAG